MSLLSREQFSGKTDIPCLGCFQSLFRYIGKVSGMTEGSVDASELLLPATKLADYCYDAMFSGCTSLTIPSELPATTIRNYCYRNMFSGCTSLKLS